jgi:hypothetical protein
MGQADQFVIGGSGIAMFLGALTDRLKILMQTDLESLLHFYLPFGIPKHGLLVVVDMSTARISMAYKQVGLDALRHMNVICVRRSELFQLSLPSPDAAAFSLPYWIKETGHLLWGRDVRPEIPFPKSNRQLLAYHIDWIHASRHRILSYLVQRRYSDLKRYLRRERTLLICTALLQRQVWRVYPETVAKQFAGTYADPDLERNIREFSLVSRMQSDCDEEQRRLAHKCVWLFERFVTRLGEISK